MNRRTETMAFILLEHSIAYWIQLGEHSDELHAVIKDPIVFKTRFRSL